MGGKEDKDATTEAVNNSGDYLGYGVYAQTLWNRVEAALNKDQGNPDKLGDDPLVVGIFGEWGAGKSKLLKLILEKAEKLASQKERARSGKDGGFGDAGFSLTVPVFFQPWKYEHEENLLVPLLLHIVQSLQETARRGQTPGEDLRQKAQIAGDAAFAALPDIVEGFEVLHNNVAVDLALAADPTGSAALLKTAGWLAKLKRKTGLPQTSLKKDFRVTTDGRFYYNFHAALKDITRPGGKPAVLEKLRLTKGLRINFVIFIDDLDRCLPEKAVETLELIKTVFNLESFAFVLALDEEVVERGIGHRYKDYALVNKKPEMPITGFEYLEKIVHLPFRLPGLTSQQAGLLVRRYEEGIQAAAEHRWFVAPMGAVDKEGTDEMPEARAVGKSAMRHMERNDQLDLLPVLTSAFDQYVPRKLIRVVELMNQIGEINRQPGRRPIARRYGEAGTLDPRVVLALVMLQLFSPDLYRFMRRRPSSFATFLGAFVHGAELPLGFYVSDASLIEWVVPGAELGVGPNPLDEVSRLAGKNWTDGRDRLAAQAIRLPLVRLLLEHRALQRNVFDPVKLFQTLAAELAHTGQNPGAVALRPYLRLMVKTPLRGGQAADKRQRHRLHQVDELLNDMLYDDASVRSNLLDQHDVPDDAYLSSGTVARLAQALDERLLSVREAKNPDDEQQSPEWEKTCANALDAMGYLDEAIAPEDRESLRRALSTAAEGFAFQPAKPLIMPRAFSQYAHLLSTWGWDERFEKKAPGLLKPEHRRSDAAPEEEPLPGFVRVPRLDKAFSIGLEGENNNPPSSVLLDHDFFMARYLTTVGQYQHFVDAKGYENPDWWDEQGLAWRNMQWASATNDPAFRYWLDSRDSEQRKRPREWTLQQRSPSAPVWGVNWFEARAYARWLTAQLDKRILPAGYEACLPTEWQWERAARSLAAGKPGDAQAPWDSGNKPSDWPSQSWANLGESEIGSCTVVGLYPPNPLGLCDLHGNLWEWQDNLYTSKPLHQGCDRVSRIRDKATEEELGKDWLKSDEKWQNSDLPALRGGAWDGTAVLARASIRHGDFFPTSRATTWGFGWCCPCQIEN